MSFNESKAQRVTGVVLVVFALILLFVLIPSQINYTGTKSVNPRTFPTIIAYCLGALGIASYIVGILHKNRENQDITTVTGKEIRLVLFTLVCMALSAFLMRWIPYLPVSVVILAVMMWVFGQRNKIVLAAVSIGVPVFIFLFFTYVLKLQLP